VERIKVAISIKDYDGKSRSINTFFDSNDSEDLKDEFLNNIMKVIKEAKVKNRELLKEN
jgi:hypothetical protein